MIKLLNKLKFDLLAVISITFLFYAITYAGSLAVFNNIDFLMIPLFIVLVCLIELLLIYLLIPERFVIIRTLTLATTLFINIFVVNLGFNDDFISLPFKYEILVMIFFVVLFSFMFKILHESLTVRKYFASLLLGFSLFTILFNYFTYHETKIAEFNYANEKVNKSDRSQLRSFPEYESNFKYDIKLNHKPNIIILTFDALVDHTTYKMLTKRQGTPFMWRMFEERLTPLKNHFSDEISTRHSLSTLLGLTPELTYNLPFDHKISSDLTPRFRQFNGQAPSALFEIFRSNGYEVSSFFVDRNAFGTFKGDYVDNFHTLPVRYGYESSVCTLIGHRTRYIGFFGYCEVLVNVKDSLLKSVAWMPNEENVFWDTSIGKLEFSHYYFHITQPYDLIKDLDAKTKPQLLFGHIVAPMHIGPLFSPNFKNKSDGSFREFVINYEKLGDYVGALIEKITDHLDNKKSDTIVYVMGDHGMMLSQRMTWTQETFVDERFSWDINNNLIYGKDKSLWLDIRDDIIERQDKEYIVHQDRRDDTHTTTLLGPSLDNEDIVVRNAEPYRRLDRYSTYGGFFSDHKCAKKSVENNKSRGYSTPQLVAHDLITCLSDYVVTENNREYIKDFKREKTLFSQAYPVCITSHSPCSKECIEIEGGCFAEGSDPVPYKDLIYE